MGRLLGRHGYNPETQRFDMYCEASETVTEMLKNGNTKVRAIVTISVLVGIALSIIVGILTELMYGGLVGILCVFGFVVITGLLTPTKRRRIPYGFHIETQEIPEANAQKLLSWREFCIKSA